MATADGDGSCGGDSRTYETRHDPDEAVALSETIIDAVATAAGVDPIACDLAFYEAVDLEALDTLFEHRSPDGHWQFEFAIDEYLVVVEGNGDVVVFEQ